MSAIKKIKNIFRSLAIRKANDHVDIAKQEIYRCMKEYGRFCTLTFDWHLAGLQLSVAEFWLAIAEAI